MLRNAALTLFLFTALFNVYGQSDCGNGRYTDPLFFDSVTVVQGVPYGLNNGVNGSPQTRTKTTS